MQLNCEDETKTQLPPDSEVDSSHLFGLSLSVVYKRFIYKNFNLTLTRAN